MNSYKNRILEILQNSDLQKVTPKTIRLQLEQEFNVDLSQDKSELKTLIFQLLDSLSGNSTDALENNTVLENKSTLDNNSALAKDTVSKESSTVSKESEVSQEQTKRKRGFQKEHYLSKELSVFLNKQTCSRTEVTREIWDYIKARNLQDAKDKRYILTDDLLFTVLKKKRMHMFEMTKVVSTHIKEAVEQEEDSQDSSRIKKKKPSRKSTSGKSTSGKSTSGKKGGWNKEYKLSKELAMVLNTEKESRPQIVKKLWEYIKSLDLQDPKDKRFIKTDDLLFKVFKTKRLNGFKMNSFLNDHLFPLSSGDNISDDNVESLDEDIKDDVEDNISDDNVGDKVTDADVKDTDDDVDNILDGNDDQVGNSEGGVEAKAADKKDLQ